jgi:hypothetical protein
MGSPNRNMARMASPSVAPRGGNAAHGHQPDGDKHFQGRDDL